MGFTATEFNFSLTFFEFFLLGTLTPQTRLPLLPDPNPNPQMHPRIRPKPNRPAPDPKSPSSELRNQTELPSDAGDGDGGNVDRVLFNNLVEMVPLVETLMDRRVKSSFTRRASMVYTPAPVQSKKSVERKSRKAFGSAQKQKQVEDNVSEKHAVGGNQCDGLSTSIPNPLPAENAENDRQELNSLKEQFDGLQTQLKSMESSLKSANETIDELKHQVTEKDSLAKSAHSQLNNVKVTLADKQAALEKLGWESMEANSKIEKLQENLESADFEMSIFTRFIEELSKSSPTPELDKNITYFDNFDNLPSLDVDEVAMEEARLAYLAAVAHAKENPSEETLALASEARIRLSSFVL